MTVPNAIVDNHSLIVRNFPAVWPFIFAVNLWGPIVLGSSVVRDAGWLGMGIAVIGLFALTFVVGVQNSNTCKQLFVGGLLLAMLQLFPILHFFAGSVGFNMAVVVHGARPPADDSDLGMITSELGGFVCAATTGGLLLFAAYASGLILLSLGLKLESTPSERIDEPADAPESPSRVV